MLFTELSTVTLPVTYRSECPVLSLSRDTQHRSQLDAYRLRLISSLPFDLVD